MRAFASRRRAPLAHAASTHAHKHARTNTQVIGNKWLTYLELLHNGHSESEAFQELGLKRYWYAFRAGRKRMRGRVLTQSAMPSRNAPRECPCCMPANVLRCCSCRRMLMTHVDLIEKLMDYNPLENAGGTSEAMEQ